MMCQSPVSWRRVKALCNKELLQMRRDPSCLLIALVLPILMLFIFGYGINLDSGRLRIGIHSDDVGEDTRSLAAALQGSAWLDVRHYPSRQALERALICSDIRGYVVLQQDFSQQLHQPNPYAAIQLVTDGSEPNIAQFVKATVQGVWQHWLRQRAEDHGRHLPRAVSLEPRFWFNPTAQSRNFIIPGSITVIMTVIGAMLTSLVVAREWERGTMEALLASPMTRVEFLLGKILPYYMLGMLSLLLCVAMARWVLGVPFRGTIAGLWVTGSAFLLSVLGIGLLISTAMRNQFNAAQTTLNAAFLPAVMLSGFIYEIASMPAPLRLLTTLMPPRHFVSCMQTLFQVGSQWELLWPDVLALTAMAALFLGLTAKCTRTTMP